MIEMGRVYRTEDGCEVRIYALDAGGQTPVHGAIKRGGVWVTTAWSKQGCWSINNSINNLVEVKPRIQREVWVNVYPHCTGDCMETKEMADSKARLDRIACVLVNIDCEEGEGL
jgi:hypothetical protein